MAESFAIEYGTRMVETLERCRQIAQSIEKEPEHENQRLQLTSAAEKRRCRRAFWRMQGTSEELAEELAYCRRVLQSFRGSSANLESKLLDRLNESGDDLIDLY